jgi:hypothetical protein
MFNVHQKEDSIDFKKAEKKTSRHLKKKNQQLKEHKEII